MEEKEIILLKRTTENKLRMSLDTLKEYYSAIRNEFLSYQNVKERMLVNFDSYKIGKVCVGKMAIAGKQLKLFLPLDVNKYETTKAHQIYVGDKKTYADTPFMVKIGSGLALRRALKLIGDVMLETSIQKDNDYQPKDFTLDYPYVENGEFIKTSKKIKSANVENDVHPFKEIVIEEKVEVVSNNISEDKMEKVSGITDNDQTSDQPNTIKKKARKVLTKKSSRPLKSTISLQTIARYFKGGVINKEILITKKLISSRTTYLIVVGNTVLLDKYEIYANKFSQKAMEEISKLGICNVIK